jgi:hypothetical protein
MKTALPLALAAPLVAGAAPAEVMDDLEMAI